MNIKRTITLIAPLLATPILGYLITEGYLSLGAGEKDPILLIPWLVWSVIFIITGGKLWKQNTHYRAWVFKTLYISIALVIGLWIVVAIWFFALDYIRNS